MRLTLETGGAGGPLLLLLHGLGATKEVWRPFLDLAPRHWRGRWAAVDLPGHGGSPMAPTSGILDLAASVGASAGPLAASDEVLVLGHSLGGMVGVALASGRHGIRPAQVLVLGLKTRWSHIELDGMAARAEAPAKLFPTRHEAADRHLKVAGLSGLVDPASEIALAGVVETEDGWRLAMSPRANGPFGPPWTADLAVRAKAPVVYAMGERDGLCRIDDLAALGGVTVLPGLGHVAMVEDPAQVWGWLQREWARRAAADA